jgi:hypothetical protein
VLDVIVIQAESGIDLARWRSLRALHPNLRPVEVFSERNPFTREIRTIATPDSAGVWVDGTCVGHFFWDASRLLCPLEYDEHQRLLERLAAELAESLGATARTTDDEELNIQPRDG